MTIEFIVTNVRQHITSKGDKFPRAILSDPENTCEHFFHMDCKNGEEEPFKKQIGKSQHIVIHKMDTNFSDTTAVMGKLVSAPKS